MTDKQESKLKTIKDVTFVYTSVSRPVKQLNKDNKPPLSDDPLEFHAYEVKIAIPESKFKSLKKSFKGAKNFPNAKEVEASEFVEKWLGGEGEEPDEDVVVVKFSQGCLFGKKGNRKPSRPVRQIGIKKAASGTYFDSKGNVVEQETAISNGTKGHLQFNPVENEFGLYLYPTAICITDLIEYTAGSSLDEGGFGIEDYEGEEPTQDEAPDDDFDDIPF
jgi:hypothetical protein